MNTEVKVVCREGEVGTLQEVIVNPKTLQPTYLVVSRAKNPSQWIRIHVRSIREVSEHEIELNRSIESLEILSLHQLSLPITV